MYVNSIFQKRNAIYFEWMKEWEGFRSSRHSWENPKVLIFPQCLSFGLLFLLFGIVWCWRSISCFRLLASLPYMSISGWNIITPLKAFRLQIPVQYPILSQLLSSSDEKFYTNYFIWQVDYGLPAIFDIISFRLIWKIFCCQNVAIFLILYCWFYFDSSLQVFVKVIFS